ncbi:uncharacterized protein NFIA_059820 [Aspergillus fischeri NRRL 181]|uniref:Uncharacterized protein n=1 Tax=Neosartorya fischeri (strain ATCC 1020 / DSM 3700 / CBS 544.65 / FGSC A1164 / JCM 1740 / NRRL 181 / WB 181) TaxID=331117 RepID=A1DPA6_NEOFI|nr:uncharacterized protein NFIA_059820 [Aspergillus fischeri NRRL 181]EAW16627.1 hypothetical protein NFIA_059820 [Aspergillus fischeri NRRL 181]
METRLKVTLSREDEDLVITGDADYSFWYGNPSDISTNLVVCEAKFRELINLLMKIPMGFAQKRQRTGLDIGILVIPGPGEIGTTTTTQAAVLVTTITIDVAVKRPVAIGILTRQTAKTSQTEAAGALRT